MKMIEKITFSEIYPIWSSLLWTNRQSKIDPVSAMCYLGGYDLVNMSYPPTFFAYMVDGEIAGVNSGHMCMDGQYRSRGLYVSINYRGQGLGTALLKRTIKQAEIEGALMCWSYPRETSWSTYQKAGFLLTSNFMPDESGNNAFCKIDIQ